MNKNLINKVVSLMLIMIMVFGLAPATLAADAGVVDAGDNLSDSLINYVVIASSNQELADTQQVVIGIGNGDKRLTEGVLTYKNTYTGDIYTVERDDNSKEALSFKFDYENKAEGVYQLVGLQYVIDGNKSEVALSDIGLNVEWGVGVDYNSTPDSVVTDEDADDMAGVANVSFDVTTDSGKKATASTIEEALEEVDSNLSVSANGVANTKASMNDGEAADIISDTGLSVSANDVKMTGAGNVVIVLDPGHGGSDSGATCNGLLEKDVNLKVATYCKSVLEQYAGVTVYMTRYDDRYVGLEERTDIAQSVGCNAFISIHMNSGGGTGAEVYYPNANYNQSASDIGYGISEKILNNIVALGMRDRGLKIRNSANGSTYPDGSIADYYSVIHNSKRRGFAGIIVEHAFMDGDYDRLCDENFLAQLGDADARGIAAYFGLDGGEDLSQYEGAFDVDYYRFFNQDLWEFNDQQCFNHWIDYGIWEGRNGSPVFDLLEYASYNQDLVDAFGLDVRQYARHFNYNGMSEGRKSTASFSVVSYKNRYKDLREAFGTDLRGYYLHYVDAGFYEDRETVGYDNQLVGGGVDRFWIIDLSDVYNYDYYQNNNSDVKSAFGIDDTATIEHFVEHGMAEGRRASAEFDLLAYMFRYPDLVAAFGWDLPQYYYHYILNGKAEGRIAV